MKILIIGANSHLGARLQFDLASKHEVVGTYHSEPLSDKQIKLDITDKEQVNSVIESVKPEVIIDVAANASPKWCDENPEEAKRINQDATSCIVEASKRIGSKIIYISSYVVMKPTILYARTKLESEKIIQESGVEHVIIRPSLIIGYSPNTTNDRPFNRLLKNLDEGTPAEYDTSWKFQPTYVGHISEVIEAVLAKNIKNVIIPVAVPEFKSRFDLANDILSKFSIKVKALDIGDKSTPIVGDLSVLKKLGLPEYTYKEMIAKIVAEIKNREMYTL
jgi:dTDP-4-dehydrorhamnose reductase